MSPTETDDGGSLFWLRDDLRTRDNPALAAACARGGPVAAVYILEDAGARRPGAAARWKLHGALAALRLKLRLLNIPLILRRGDPRALLPDLAGALDATFVCWNRRYTPGAVAIDRTIKTDLASDGFEVASFNGALLVEPWQARPKGGGYYKVFTAFCRAARALNADLRPLPAPEPAPAWRADVGLGDALEDWSLEPTGPDWAGGLRAAWGHGEDAAAERLAAFLDAGFAGYRTGRDLPGAAHVSGLSPHLRFGEIGPRQVRAAAIGAAEAAGGARDGDGEAFERELYWRDFSHNLLFNVVDLETENFQPKFDRFTWRTDAAALHAWQTGQTGYPIVDAGMRQLWETGWMHNRVRMIAASFLTKHLMIDWRAGERWFWDTLVDADAASNPANWQWVAGSGADAAPYFRIFNPMTQAKKFDPQGAYVRRWVPELAGLADTHLYAPWEAPERALDAAGVKLDEDYPRPIVDHKAARERALAAFKRLSGA